jgi:hypothetical protein
MCVKIYQHILVLRKENTILTFVDFNSKEIMKLAKILESEFLVEISKQRLRGCLRGTDNNNIITQRWVEKLWLCLVIEKQRSVGFWGMETKILYLCAESRVPCPRGLLQTIQCFVQLTDVVRCRLILISGCLLREHFLLSSTMRKHILYAQLTKALSLWHTMESISLIVVALTTGHTIAWSL